MLHTLKHTFTHPQRWQRWIKYFFLDIKFGKKYLGKMIFNQDDERGYVRTASTDYDALDILFSEINIRQDDVFMDIGCGKGRVFNWLLNQGVKNKLIGLEVDPRVAQFTKKRLEKYKQVEIINGAIENGLPKEATIFYLFHPFGERLVALFADMLMQQIKKGDYKQKNRPLIIYYHCHYLNIFENNPAWKIQKFSSISFMNLPAAIIEPNV